MNPDDIPAAMVDPEPCTLRWPGRCSVYTLGHRCVNNADQPHQCACGATT